MNGQKTTDQARANGGLKWVNSTIPFRVGDGTSGPAIPVMAYQIGMSVSQIGLMEAGFSVSSIIGGFLWGRLSDELKRRKAFILLSFAGTALVLLLFALSSDAFQFMALRALHGFIIAAFVAVTGALVVERSRKERLGEAMGHMNMVGGYAFIGGMALGAGVALFLEVRYLFLLAGILTAASLVTAFLMIQEPRVFLRRGEIHRLLADKVLLALNAFVQRRLYRPSIFVQRPKLTPIRRRVLAYLVALFGVMLGGVATFALLPVLLLGPYGAGVVETFLVLLAGSLMSAIFYRPVGRLVDRIGFRRTLTMGLGMRSSVFLLLALSLLFLPNLLAITTINLLAGVTWAFVMTAAPTALFRAMQVKRRGEMMGYYNMFMALGSAVGAAAGGIIAFVYGFLVLFLFSGAATAVSTIAIWRLNLG